MGSKKRESTGAEKVENQVDNQVLLEPLNKKMKREKKKEVADGPDAPSTTQSIAPIERKKKGKALDKERHRAAFDDVEATPKTLNLKINEARAPISTSPRNSLRLYQLPRVIVRQAAVESLVTELQEVQTADVKLEKKELVEGALQLEAEKDDGLSNCAPSLRYAVPRLICGVSSSREMANQENVIKLYLAIIVLIFRWQMLVMKFFESWYRRRARRGCSSSSSRKKGKRSMESGGDDSEFFTTMKECTFSLTDELKQLNTTFKLGNRVKDVSGEQVFNELESLGLDLDTIDEAYTFLNSVPGMMFAFFEYPIAHRRRWLMKELLGWRSWGDK